jgi:FkbM family methyltransferase
MHSAHSEPSRRDVLLARLRERVAEFEQAGELVRPVAFDRLTDPEVADAAREMFDRIRTLEPEPLSVETFFGEAMTVVVPELISLLISQFQFFEYGLSSVLLQRLEPGMHVVDVGAHLGYFTLLAATLVGPTGSVHAFEPTPGTFALLRQNAGGRPNVVLNERAVFSRSGRVEIQDYGLMCAGWNSLFGPRPVGLPPELLADIQANARRHVVEAVPLDEYLAGAGVRPHFVKVDAESAEGAILAGMTQTLRDVRPLLAIEIGDFPVPGAATTRELIGRLEPFDYVPLEFDHARGTLVRHTTRAEYPEADNLFFVPAEKMEEDSP